MNIKLYITDYLIWGLVLISFIQIVRAIKKSSSRRLIGDLFKSPINVVAIIILIVYLIIGLLDSIHLKYPHQKNYLEEISVLDLILTPLRTQNEITYSAPFSLYSAVKESQIINEKQVRDYPRLNYGGAHLKNQIDKKNDIYLKLSITLAMTFIVWGTCALLFHCLTLFPLSTATITGHMTLLIVIFAAIFIYHFMPYYHILGTNQIGEDVLYQGLKSIRTGLVIGTVTTGIMLPFALVFGLMAGYLKGWVDDVIQYIYTTLSAIPGVLLIAAAVLSLQTILAKHQYWFETVYERADLRLLALCIILGLTSWTTLCRLLRGEALKLSQMDFVATAHSFGLSSFKIMIRHLLPNVMHIVLICIILDFSGLVLAEAVLSYVGVGVDPATYSWGMMINSARLEMSREPIIWWSLLTAFGMMFLLVLSANIFSDHVRELLDPKRLQ